MTRLLIWHASPCFFFSVCRIPLCTGRCSGAPNVCCVPARWWALIFPPPLPWNDRTTRGAIMPAYTGDISPGRDVNACAWLEHRLPGVGRQITRETPPHLLPHAENAQRRTSHPVAPSRASGAHLPYGALYQTRDYNLCFADAPASHVQLFGARPGCCIATDLLPLEHLGTLHGGYFRARQLRACQLRTFLLLRDAYAVCASPPYILFDTD